MLKRLFKNKQQSEEETPGTEIVEEVHQFGNEVVKIKVTKPIMNEVKEVVS